MLLSGVVLSSGSVVAEPQSIRATAHITSQTTTTLVAAVTGQQIQIHGGSICVDANGATTGVALEDSGATNLVGTGVVYVLGTGQCWYFPRDGKPWIGVVGAGLGLNLVTTVGNGPVNVNLEIIQR